MSQPQQELTSEQSIYLGQLIQRRRPNDDISEEIKNLIRRGCSIDYQDLDRNSNTYLHFAVNNYDVKCVEFLMKFKPNLDIKNQQNLTAIELANILINKNILSVVDSVDHNFIHTFNFNELSRDKLQAISSSPTFKVLKIDECKSVAALLRFLKDQNFAEIFRETLNFFFIDVSVEDEFDTLTEADLDILNQIFPETRPWILQITSCDSMVFYKEENSKTVHKVEEVDTTEDELEKKFLEKESCNLNLLLQALSSLDTYGDFTWQNDVLNISLKKSNGRIRLTNIFASHNSLCLRFLTLFEETLDDNQWLERVLAVMKCKEISPLLAFLDHPFTVRDHELRLTNILSEQLFRVDFKNKNLLMIATETNNVEVVKYLLRFGFNLAAYGTDYRTAVDIAWDKKFYGCFAAIIEADSQFPRCFSPEKSFNVNEIPCGADRIAIEKTLNEKEIFITNVREGNLEAVKTLVNSKPQLKKCFSTSNKTALTIALENKKFDVYLYLRSEGFSYENDIYISGVYASLTETEKDETSGAQMKLFNKVDQPHLAQLLSKSRISFGTKTSKYCYLIIAKIYSALNEVDEVSAIMKLIGSLELEIVFDFNSDNVRDMDPSKTKNIRGTSYYKKGHLYVGALNHETDFRGILGTLAHEMCHLAMHLVYDNNCLPFRQNDEVRRKDFEKVYDDTFKFYQANLTIETIISNVFTSYNNENMSEGDRSHVKLAELIVRVPHILAKYKDNKEDNEKLDDLKRDFCSLFNYYRDFVHEDIIEPE